MAEVTKSSLITRLAGKAAVNRLARRGLLDWRLGLTLMRDGRVPMRTKGLALGLGAVLMTCLVALEVPLEGVLALAVPLLGTMVDLTADGAEELLGTLVLAAILLPWLTPRALLAEIRAEI